MNGVNPDLASAMPYTKAYHHIGFFILLRNASVSQWVGVLGLRVSFRDGDELTRTG